MLHSNEYACNIWQQGADINENIRGMSIEVTYAQYYTASCTSSTPAART